MLVPAQLKVVWQERSMQTQEMHGALHSYRVLSDELVGMFQRLNGVWILRSQALLAPVEADDDHLAAHEEALPGRQTRLAGQLSCLGQQVGRQVLQSTSWYSENNWIALTAPCTT